MIVLYLIILKIEILGTLCIMSAHALGDTPIQLRGNGRVHQWVGERSLCFA